MKRKTVTTLLILLLIICLTIPAAAQGQGTGSEAPRQGAVLSDPLRAGQDTPGQGTPNQPVNAPDEMTQFMYQHNIRHTYMHQHQVLVNGHPLESDLPPVIIDGRIRIPVRAVSVALAAEVDWDPDERTITITRGETTVLVAVDETTYYINGEAFEMDVAPEIYWNRGFVPLSFIAKALGDEVDWDDEAKTAFIRCAWNQDEDEEDSENDETE